MIWESDSTDVRRLHVVEIDEARKIASKPIGATDFVVSTRRAVRLCSTTLSKAPDFRDAKDIRVQVIIAHDPVSRQSAFFHPHGFSRLLIVCFMCCTNLAAIDPHQPITQMHHTAWSAKEGVIGEVLAIAQTSDGFIWVGTTGGLLRFDGSEFERYKPEVGSFPQPSWVSALLATPDGGLWIGNLSGGASFLKLGKISNYGRP